MSVPEQAVTKAALLPCPFCGGEAKAQSWTWPYYRWRVVCSLCKCQASGLRADPSDAIAAWNTRLTPAQAVEYKLPVKRVENYSGEHREWVEEYVLPEWLVKDIQRDVLSAEARSAGPVDVVERVARAICKAVGYNPDEPNGNNRFGNAPLMWESYRETAIAAIGPAGRGGVGEDALREALVKIIAEKFEDGGGCVEGPDWDWNTKEADAVFADTANTILAALSPQPTATEGKDRKSWVEQTGELPENMPTATGETAP